MSTVMLLGAGGQLSNDLLLAAGGRNVTAVTHADLDVTDRDAVMRTVERFQPDLIVNAAAYVDVEGCETNAELAFAVNADGVRNIADTGVALVQVSTDYVFDGRASAPYAEDAATNPINVYGASKLAGEKFARGHLIVRTSGLYGVAPTRAKGNFVSTMLRLGRERGELAVVDDQVLTPTSTADLAPMLWRLIDSGARGLYHATNAGECSWFEFARAIFELAGMNVKVRPISSAEFGAKAPRPAYSVLDTSKLAREGFGSLRPWREALASHLERLARST